MRSYRLPQARLASLALVAALALAGCGGDNNSGSTAPASPSAGGSASSGTSGSLDAKGTDACNKVDQAGQITGNDPISKARRTRLLLQAADSARQSSVPQIKDVPSLVGGAVSGSGGTPVDQVRGICAGLGWSPS